MYLCICNAISDRQVRALAESGITQAPEVYRALGCAPQCGKCIPFVQETLTQAVEAGHSGGGAASGRGPTLPAE